MDRHFCERCRGFVNIAVHNDSGYVLNLLEEVVVYDEAECDGYCLMNDIKAKLEWRIKMREIIFRGKRIDNGEWTEGNYNLVNGKHYINSICGDLYDLDYGQAFHEVDSETIGQYTGLKDINGTMIFEGDILGEADDKECVVYEENFACFALEYNDVAGNMCTSTLYSCLDNQEVVGNIHDKSPEEMED